VSGVVIARVFVPGRGRTKGHLQPVHVPGRGGRPCRFGGAKDRPLTQKWMRTLAESLRSQLGIVIRRIEGKPRRVDAEPYAGPVRVDCFFRFERTASEREDAEAGEVWPSHDLPWPTARSIGDEDTLRRAVLDALTKSGVISDDSMSVGGMNWKRWTVGEEQAGVLVVVSPAPEPEYVRFLEGQWDA
jgi:hypothetical protein